MNIGEFIQELKFFQPYTKIYGSSFSSPSRAMYWAVMRAKNGRLGGSGPKGVTDRRTVNIEVKGGHRIEFQAGNLLGTRVFIVIATWCPCPFGVRT